MSNGQWSTDSLFPLPPSPDFQEILEIFSGEIEQLKTLMEAMKKEGLTKEYFIRWYELANPLLDLQESLQSFVYMLYSTETTNPSFLQAMDEVEKRSLVLTAVQTDFVLLFKDSEISIEEGALLLGDERFVSVLTEAKKEGTRLMAPPLEALAMELQRSGAEAWGKLHSSLSSSLETLWDPLTGEKRTMVQLRQGAAHQEREIRKKSFEKELELWEQHSLSFGAALNGVKGWALSLEGKRGWESPLEKSLFQSRFSPGLLEQLLWTMESALPLFQKYYKTKAQYLGLEKLSFYDLLAPLGKPKQSWTFQGACDLIQHHFSRFSSSMGLYAKKAIEGGWVHWKNQKGKVGGAYCTSLPTQGESRILMNFGGSFGDVRTLAHELGHGYHFEMLKDLPASLRYLPMPLAETASLFSENLIFERSMEEGKGKEKLFLLDNHLLDSAQVIVDILSRFYFEKEIFERRKNSDIGAPELCQIMIDCQEKTYGELEVYHPYMWAVKGHYYSASLGFYNYPYAFGFLFSLGLLEAGKQDPQGFPLQYQELLRATGFHQSIAIGEKIGYNLEERSFWEKSLKVLEHQIDSFISQVEENKYGT